MEKCTLCGTELDSNHPAIIASKLDSISNWGKFEGDDTSYGMPVGSTFNVSGLPNSVAVESKKIRPELSDFSDGGYYGGESEYPQGTEFQTYIILRYGDQFFKKTGAADSYGEIVWSGIVKPTKPKEITVTSWE